jgi:hypothetical protein
MALADFGVRVSPSAVARLLHQMGYSLCLNHKQLSTDHSPDRNHQFLYLGDLRDRFARRGLPVISVDTKKRELVGQFKNSGTRWDLSPRLVNDHSDSTGVAIPYGIYDLLANRGSVVVGVSHDTPTFAAHAIAHWWRQEGSLRYPLALDNFSFSAIPAAVTVLVAALGKPNSSPNWPIPTAYSHRRPLPHRCFQMESYRASSLFPDLQKLGWRTPRQLSQDPSLHSFHQNSIRHVGHCSSRPSALSDRHRTYTGTTSCSPHQSPPNPTQVELHYLTQSVKLFLRRSSMKRVSLKA